MASCANTTHVEGPSARFGRSLAVVVGADVYGEGISPLRSAVADARALAETLRRDHGFEVWQLLDDDAQLLRLRALLHDQLPGALGPADRLLFYFAGHGIALDGNAGPAGYLVPARARRSVPEDFLPMHELYGELARLAVRHALVILDCCFAGAFRWSTLRDIAPDAARMYRERYDRYIESAAWQVLTSASSDQLALDRLADARGEGSDAHSPFARALLEGLAGAADYTRDNVITADELAIYVRERVAPAVEALGRRQIPQLFPLERHDGGQFVFQVPHRPIHLDSAPALDENTNPYRGLLSFSEHDRALFFGREPVIAQLAEAVAARPLTVVVGPSGSGKSSLVHAGLMPEFRAKGWVVLPTQRPGNEPLATLAAWAGALGVQPGLADPEAAWLAAVDGSRTRTEGPCLAIVDQFEELLTHRTSERERSRFLDALESALDAAPWLHLVVTVRSDAEPQFHATALERWWSAARFAVPTMTRDELRQIIERPAAATVLYFEPSRLVERLLDDVALVPAPLPLLSFALSELYRRCWKRWQGGSSDRALREADYDEMGSVARALTQRATAIYDHLVGKEPAYSTTIRNIMFRMVTDIGGEIARRRVPLAELVYEDPAENQRVAEVLQRLHEVRLISLGTEDAGDPIARGAAYAEPSHDELVRGWVKVAAWLDEIDQPAGTRGLLAALADAVRFWNDHERSESYLWVDPRVELLRSIGLAHRFVYNAGEARFVAASTQRRHRRRVRTIGGLIVASAALAIIAGIALWQRDRAADNAAEANRQRVIATANADQANRNADEAKQQRDESRRLLAQAFQDTGRQLSLEYRYQEAIPYLAAARERGADGSALRALFWVASRSLPLVAPLEHSSVVWSAAFSPDGTRIVTASDDGAARIWDAGSGALVATLRHHEPVLAAAFSRDGARVLSVTGKAEYAWDGNSGNMLAGPGTASPGSAAVVAVEAFDDVHIRNAATSRSLAVPRDRATVSRILMTVDGMRFDDVSSERDVRTWDAGTAKCIATLVKNPDVVRSVAYSADDAKIAIAYDDHLARVWSLATGKPVSPVLVHGDKISRVALSRDGARVVTAGFDGTARVWEVATGRLVVILKHQAVVTSAEFDFKGERVVTASYDRTARVWDIASGSPAAAILQHQGPVWDAVFSPDGTRVVTAGHDHTARIWDVAERPLVSLLRHQGKLVGVMFDASGARVITASEDHTARVWDVATGRPAAYVLRHQGPVNGAAFSPDGTRIVTTSNYTAEQWSANRITLSPDFTAAVWDAANGRLISTLQVEDQLRAYGATFSPEGTRILAMDGDTAYVWDAATGKLRTTLRHQPAVTSASAVGRDGLGVRDDLIVTNARGGGQTIYGIGRDGRFIALRADEHGVFSREMVLDVNSAAFSPDGRRVVTTSTNNAARVWDAATGALVVTFAEHQGRLNGAAFSPDGSRIVTASSDNTARVWDAATGHVHAVLAEHLGRVNAAVFSADGTRIVTASDDRTARIWDAASGKPLAAPLEHRGPVNSAAFSPDGARIVTASDDRTAVIWDTASGKPLAVLGEHQGRVTRATFSPDGTHLVTASDDSTARVWQVRLDDRTAAEWSVLAGRSPFVLQGSVHVRRPPVVGTGAAR